MLSNRSPDQRVRREKLAEAVANICSTSRLHGDGRCKKVAANGLQAPVRAIPQVSLLPPPDSDHREERLRSKPGAEMDLPGDRP
jgi:hypothetical protein